MAYIFQSSIIRGGDILTPDVIEIDNYGVTLRKRNRNLFRKDETTIPFRSIAFVKVDTHVISADIIIQSYGGEKLIGRKFSVADAKEIEKLIKTHQIL